MNDDFPNERFRPTATDDRPRYRFEDYETDETRSESPVDFQPYHAPQVNAGAAADVAKDAKQLDQLALGFRIYAIVNALFSSFPIIHLVIGIMVVTGGFDDGNNPPPAFFGWFFIVFASLFILFGYAISACNFYAARFLKERRNYTFCFVMSCINCAFMPLGTVLGVFSLIVLLRDSVKEMFKSGAEETLLG